jgi:hypothetical protein
MHGWVQKCPQNFIWKISREETLLTGGVDHRVCEGVDWTQQTKGRVQWWDSVNVLMNVGFYIKVWNFLSN